VKNSPQVSLYVILPEVILGGLKDEIWWQQW